jgi:drug/metabolite transporter (DMT)-like permease
MPASLLGSITVTQRLPVAVLVTSAIMWGLTWWPLKFFHGQGIDGLALILVGYGAVALVTLPWLWRERRAYRGERHLALLMVFLGGYANLAFAEAMIYGEVVRAMMLFYLAPVWGVLGGRVFLGERLDWQRTLGVVLALGGAFLVLGAWQTLATPPGAVDLLALTAGMAFALNNVTCRAAQRVPVPTKTGVTFIGCAIMAGALMLLDQASLPSANALDWSLLAGFGLGWLLLATLGTAWAVTHMEAGRASVILIIELLAAVVSATLIGGETLEANELAGGVLIFSAALLEARRTR